MLITTQFVRLAALARTTGAGGPLAAAKAKLLKGALSPNDDTTAAICDALIATFPGFAEIPVVWSAPAIGTTRQPFQESQLLLWICSANPAATEQIFGVYYVDSVDETILLGVDMFPAPVAVAKKYDSVQWICTVP